MVDPVYHSPDMPPPNRPPVPPTAPTTPVRDFHKGEDPVAKPLDHEATYKLLLLARELAAHGERFASLKALVDQDLVDANAGAKVEADRRLLERRRKEQELQSRKDREAAVLAAGGPAHDLLNREAAEKKAREDAVKAAAEADRIAKEKFDREEAARRAADPHALRPPMPTPSTPTER